MAGGDDRLAGEGARRWGAKDAAIAVLALVALGLGAVVARDHLPWAAAGTKVTKGEAVQVFDVVLDRKERRYLDLLFDRPLGQAQVGEVLGRAPATLSPSVGGFWRWRAKNVLRFEPTDRFAMATEYTVSLIPERILGKGQHLAGKTDLTVRTDQFLLEQVDLFEEPALEGHNQVLVRGNLRFNYPVEPAELASHLRLVDPLLGPEEPVEVKLETTYANAVVGFRSAPVEKRPEERNLVLTVAADLTPADGNVPLGHEVRREVPLGSSERLAVRGVEVTAGDPESTLHLHFSSPISPAIADGYLTVEPKVRFRLSGDRNELVVTGAFRPGERYRLALAQGFPAKDDAVLQEAWSSEVTIPHLEPSLDFQSEGMFLSASGYHNVALQSVNVSKAHVVVDRVYRSNLFMLFQYFSYSIEGTAYAGSRVSHALGDRIAEETLDLGGKRDEKVVTPLGLDRFIEGHGPGLYRVLVNRVGDWQAVQRWVVLTDLGAVAKVGTAVEPGSFDLWVSSFRDLAPVAGARVRLVSDQNQELATGRTDAEGRFGFRDAAGRFAEERPYLVTVEKGDDWSFLLLDRTRVDTTGLDVAGATRPRQGYTAYLYGERDLYRPGETVRGVAVVRDAALATPPAMPVVLRHRDPQGRVRDTVSLTTDRRGLVPFSLPMPAYELTGPHTLELLVADEVVGRYRFQLEEFVPDRIKVSIGRQEGAVGPGEELAYRVESAYLFGPPAAGLAVESRVRLADATFAPPGFAEYTFRNEERELDGREILSSQGKLDDEGHADFSARIPAGASVPSSLEAVVTARVAEAGGRGVSALLRVPVHPYPYYLGLHRPEGYATPGKPFELSWVAVAPDGRTVPSGALRADFFRDRWNTVLRRTPSGGFAYETSREPELVDSVPVAAGSDRGLLSFTPPETGSYRVVLTDPESAASTEVSFYASGWGFAPWALSNPARVELDLEHEEVEPGGRAVVQVRAPFAGRLLVTLERDRVLWSRVLTLSGNSARVEIPVPAEARPNAYVTATLVRGVGDLEPGSVGRAFGAVPIEVDRTANRLSLAIDAPQKTRPRSPLEVAVRATPGAVVTLAAVDEGILQLIAQPTADPFSYFYRKLALGVSTHDLYSLLLPEVAPQGTSPAGGGEGGEAMAQHLRTEGIRRVKPVAFWSGVVEAGSDGVAHARFELPDFQGSLRLMAVALDGRRFGSADRRVQVRDPLVLSPTLPRALAFGDSARLPATLRNDTGRGGEFTISLEASGAASLEATQGEAQRTVELENGAETTVYFPVRSGDAPGAARFAFSAQGPATREPGEGAEERATASAEVPVLSDLPALTSEEAGAVGEPSLTLTLPAPERFRPETLRRELSLGPVPLVQFSGHLRELLRYPYGCLEQTVSSVFPLLYFSDLARRLDPELYAESDPAASVQAAIQRVGALQLPGGGFALWPGGNTLYPWGSVYAAHFLVEARRAGYDVPGFLYDGSLGFLAREVRAGGPAGAARLERQVYALYVLARAGQPELAAMDVLRQRQAASLSPSSRALLAAAYATVGDPKAADELAGRIAEQEKVARQVERQTGGNLGSALRNRALLLLGLEEAAPDDERVPRLVDRLAREAGSVDVWNTQEASFVFLALGELFHRQEARADYAGTVWVGKRRVGSFTGEPVSFRDIPGTEPVRIEMKPGYRAGSAFYSLRTRGVPTRAAFAPSAAGLEVERKLVTRGGGEADLAAVEQGDLLVVEVRVRSTVGPVANVVVENRLPSGLEVENQRLATTETLPWIGEKPSDMSYVDLRDDRVLLFADLPADQWRSAYVLVRAVTPGRFHLPPVHAEAMYDPALAATGPAGEITVNVRK